jgi:Uracil DNA glycosylase superfamily
MLGGMALPSFTIEALAKQIPAELLPKSGKVFYSGRCAFSAPSALYVLGVNPGGDPSDHETETVGGHTHAIMQTHADDWSAYRDESWEGTAPGTYGMAPRVLHLFAGLGLNPGNVPCSNLVFVRSRRENQIEGEMTSLADLCWSFHAHAIERLQPRAILCFGKTAGNYVRRKVGANRFYGEFVETNNRRWRSQTFVNPRNLRVVVATHPSIADWCATNTDPSNLIHEALEKGVSH